MTKTFKRITALAAAAITVGAISAAAYAVDVIGIFHFNVYGYGHYKYSDPVTRVVSDDYAAVRCTDGIISETNFMFLSVCNYKDEPGSAVTSTTKATKVDDYILIYNVTPGSGKEYCLRGQIGYYDAYLEGNWAP